MSGIAAIRDKRQRTPHGWSGTILDDAATATSRVRVSLPAFADDRQYFGPMPFLPRGAVLPSAGDPCLVLGDEAGAQVIVWWEPA